MDCTHSCSDGKNGMRAACILLSSSVMHACNTKDSATRRMSVSGSSITASRSSAANSSVASFMQSCVVELRFSLYHRSVRSSVAPRKRKQTIERTTKAATAHAHQLRALSIPDTSNLADAPLPAITLGVNAIQSARQRTHKGHGQPSPQPSPTLGRGGQALVRGQRTLDSRFHGNDGRGRRATVRRVRGSRIADTRPFRGRACVGYAGCVTVYPLSLGRGLGEGRR